MIQDDIFSMVTDKGVNKGSSGKRGKKITPMLQQYLEIKERYPDAILFYRMGDFYEMFYEDAEVASRILEITLTSRDRNKEDAVPMCGVPVHAAENYLTRLVLSGKRVAVCEQVEDPKSAKGLVKRDVVRVVTPGLITTEGSIGAKTNNFLVALRPPETRGPWGISCLDISTGEFRLTEVDGEEAVLAELFRLEPAEILLPESLRDKGFAARAVRVLPNAFVTYRADSWFRRKRARELIKEQFSAISLDGFGLSGFSTGIDAAGALLAYAHETQKSQASHITSISPYWLGDHLVIDEATKRNLELVANAVDQSVHGSLLDVLDMTVTPMGGRLLRKWILYPLRDKAAIEERLDAVEALKRDDSRRKRLRKAMRHVHDLERLIARTVLGTANARDLLSLGESLSGLPELRSCLDEICAEWRGDHDSEKGTDETVRPVCRLGSLLVSLDLLDDVAGLIKRAIRQDCALHLREGRLIAPGYNAELDELVALQKDGRSFIAGVEARERERTGISSLKVGYNKVFGYFIEVPKSQSAKVPDDYIRKQTLVSAERYITPEIKEIEAKILTAQERRLVLEYELFQQVRAKVAENRRRIQTTAAVIAELDCLASLARAAIVYNYVRPEITEQNMVDISEGRHPVVERTIDSPFVPNDISLDHDKVRLVLITGPNMAGKSTVLRQTALIVLMAHAGSFVPAARAKVGLTDRIFTRVGATDYLARGQSTFMVEMSETANILRNATARSLVILDEIGRGTSTYDGLSIAWAVAEHLLGRDGGQGTKTLFATHYHELTELAHRYDTVLNMHVAVKEWENRIVFLHRLREGATNKSYGIQVAALAGVPDTVVRNAIEILERIERQAEAGKAAGSGKDGVLRPRPVVRITQQALPLEIEVEHACKEIRERLLEVDVNNMTPVQALNLVAELKEMVAG